MATTTVLLTTTWVKIDINSGTIQNRSQSNKALFALQDTDVAPGAEDDGQERKGGQSVIFLNDGRFLYARAETGTCKLVVIE